MAETRRGTNDPLTPEQWSERAFIWALSDTIFARLGLMGLAGEEAFRDPLSDQGVAIDNGGTPLLVVDKDLTKEAGDKVTFEIERPITGEGGGDDADALDHMQELVMENFKVAVHERVWSMAMKGKMSMKRSRFVPAAVFARSLSRRLTEAIETDAFKALSGLYNASGIATVTEAYPSTNRIFYGGQTTGGVIEQVADDANIDSTTTNLFGSAVLAHVRRMAVRGTSAYPRLRPLRINGRNYFLYFADTLQRKALESETAWPTWVKDAEVKGRDNPLFSEAAALIHGIIVVETDRTARRTGAGNNTPGEGFALNGAHTVTTDPCASGITVARGLFCGAEALCLAWGQLPQITSDMLDIKRKPASAIDAIYGLAKTRFNLYDADADTNTAQEDHGVIAVDTAVIPD